MLRIFSVIIIGAVLFCSIPLMADYDVIIGESTSLTQNNPYCPYHTNSASANIILRSELPPGAGGEIVKISFYMDGSSADPYGYTKDVDMYMSQTSATEVTTGTSITEGTLVYDNIGSSDNYGWIVHILDTPFNWTTDNLLITYNNQMTFEGGGFPPDNYFRYTTAPGNLSGWVNRNDGVQPTTLTDGTSYGIDSQRPNIKLTFAGTIGIDEFELPDDMKINVYPNPFNSAVTISAPSEATIEIFDLNGKRVGAFEKTPCVWTAGESVSSGIYLIKASVGNKTITKYAVLIR